MLYLSWKWFMISCSHMELKTVADYLVGSVKLSEAGSLDLSDTGGWGMAHHVLRRTGGPQKNRWSSDRKFKSLILSTQSGRSSIGKGGKYVTKFWIGWFINLLPTGYEKHGFGWKNDLLQNEDNLKKNNCLSKYNYLTMSSTNEVCVIKTVTPAHCTAYYTLHQRWQVSSCKGPGSKYFQQCKCRLCHSYSTLPSSVRWLAIEKGVSKRARWLPVTLRAQNRWQAGRGPALHYKAHAHSSMRVIITPWGGCYPFEG